MILKEMLEGRIGKKDLEEIADIAHGDACIIEELFGLACDNSSDSVLVKRSANAAWAIQHLQESDLIAYIYPRKDAIIDALLASSSDSKQRIFLSTLRETEIKEEELRTDFLDFCMEGMLKTELPFGVRAQCIHLAFKQCRHYPELIDELERQLDMMDNDLLPAGIKSAKQNAQKQIKAIKKKRSSHA